VVRPTRPWQNGIRSGGDSGSPTADDVAALCWELGVEQASSAATRWWAVARSCGKHPDLVSGLVLAATSFSFVLALQQRLRVRRSDGGDGRHHPNRRR
jgi:hypothetical protein